MLIIKIVDAKLRNKIAQCNYYNELVSDFDGYKSRAFALGKARTATRRVSTEALRKSLDVLVEADTKMKTSLKDQKTTFRPFMEQLIARLLLIAKEGRV